MFQRLAILLDCVMCEIMKERKETLMDKQDINTAKAQARDCPARLIKASPPYEAGSRLPSHY